MSIFRAMKIAKEMSSVITNPKLTETQKEELTQQIKKSNSLDEIAVIIDNYKKEFKL